MNEDVDGVGVVASLCGEREGSAGGGAQESRRAYVEAELLNEVEGSS